MTNAVTLTGQWDGLRAFPRTLRTPDHRQRLETGLEKLSGLYEAMSLRAAQLRTGLGRLEGLRAGLIDQLDAMDAPAIDLEPSGDDEPSLCHPGSWGFDDLEEQCEGEGEDADHHGEPNLGWGFAIDQRQTHSSPNDMEAQCDDEGFADVDREPSLCGTVGNQWEHAVGAGIAGIGPMRALTFDLEAQCEDEGHDSDREPEEHF